MITKEEYELLNRAVNMFGEPAYMGYRNLIESLRAVARAAQKLSERHKYHQLMGECVCAGHVGTQEALDAVPAWCLDE